MKRGFVYQTGTFCYHNIWREDRDWSIIYTADKGVVDLTINFILLQRKPVFIMNKAMSVYREVVDPAALNFRSVCIKDRATDIKQMTQHLEHLEVYFGGSIDLSDMWSDHLLSYTKGLVFHRSGNYRIGELIDIYSRSSRYTKKKFRKELFDSLTRKIRKI